MTHLVSLRRFRLLALTGLLLPVLLTAQDQMHRGRKYKPPPPTSKISVTVLKSANGKPVQNAAVVFRPMKGNKTEGNLELKTNEEGKVSIDVIPVGDTVQLQVIADGYQTFGDTYDITTDSRDILIKLTKPDKQYSIYDKHPEAQRGGAVTNPGSTPSDSATAQAK